MSRGAWGEHVEEYRRDDEIMVLNFCTRLPQSTCAVGAVHYARTTLALTTPALPTALRVSITSAAASTKAA